LTTDQVDRLGNTLFPKKKDAANTLQGRSVLIPFSKQAFLVGELQPTLDESGQEQVQILLNEEKVTVSTQAAQEWLVQHSSSTIKKPTKLPTTKKKTPSQKTAPILKTTSSAPPLGGGGGFVEIQEEYNPGGKQVHGTVVDVSKQLSAIWNNALEPALEIPSNNHNNDGDDDDFEPKIEEPPLKPISDQEYESLSQRLEELARLEEEAAKPKSKSKSSSFGFKKGFLTSNNKAKAAKKKKPSNAATTSSEQPKTTTTTQSIPTAPSTTSNLPSAETNSTKSPSGGVSFDTSQNQVQEIPRIGTNPVPPKTTTKSRPLDANIFSGIIQERPMVPPVIQERPMMPVNNNSRQAQPPKKKRQSRFAQERQQY
jgi:hypothetical protein